MAAHQDLKRGLTALATITSIAPFIGIFGTIWAIAFDTFVSVGNRLTGLAVVADGLSRACVLSALGLVVGLQSLWCYSYLRERLQQLDLQIKSESQRLLNLLTIRFPTAIPAGMTASLNPTVPYLETYEVTTGYRRHSSRSSIAAVALLIASACIQVVRYFDHDFLPLGSAVPAAFVSVLTRFCLSWLLACAVWMGLLHRKSSGLLLAAALLCLFWCAGGLLLPV